MLFKNIVSALYLMNLNNIILFLIIELVSFLVIRGLIAKKIKKKLNIIIWHPDIASILKMIFWAFHIYVAVYGILVFCPVRETEANPIPLYALYQFVMNKKTDPMELCLINMVFMFPVGQWTGEVMKSARSIFLYKWTAVITGIVGIYMEYSQYALGVGRPATDDLICIVLGCLLGIFSRDVWEKLKQFWNMVNQLFKNEQKKRKRAEEKAEREKIEKEEQAEREAERIAAEKEEQEAENERIRQKRKEALDPYVSTVTGSFIYKRLRDIAEVFVVFLLAAVQWVAELVADRQPDKKEKSSDKEKASDKEDDSELDDDTDDEPRWRKLKRENQKQARNPLMKKSRRMKRAAMRKLKSKDDVDLELDEEKEMPDEF